MISLFVRWDVDPELFRVGAFPLFYYSILFGLGFFLAYQVFVRLRGFPTISPESIDTLLGLIIAGAIIGARLGHCLFYDWAYFSQHPTEIFLPWKGAFFGADFEWIGYRGLASHGGGAGAILAIYAFAKWKRIAFLGLLDRMAIVVPLAGACIRVGNLLNSEILGRPTEVPWAFVFARVDEVPRHPAQLYEAFGYLLVFAVVYGVYRAKQWQLAPGAFFGLFLVLLFMVRFAVEFVKEDQVAFERGMALNMGQWLSLPYMAVGLGLLAWALWRKKKSPSVG